MIISRKEKVLRRKVYSEKISIINKLKYNTKFCYNKESCPICLIELNKEYFIFNCKHFMHKHCVIQYNKNICPIYNEVYVEYIKLIYSASIYHFSHSPLLVVVLASQLSEACKNTLSLLPLILIVSFFFT